jgi:hypothetical protein
LKERGHAISYIHPKEYFYYSQLVVCMRNDKYPQLDEERFMLHW